MYNLKEKNNIIKKIFVMFFCLFFLFGCEHHYFEKVKLIRSDDYHAALVMNQMQKSGAIILQDEKNITLRIPARYLFYSESANLNFYSHSMLDNVVKVLGYYDTDLLKITSYNYINNSTTNIKRAQAISLERARQVMKYLWSQKVNASFIYPEGKLVKHLNKNDKIAEGYIDVNFEKFYR